MEQAKTSNNETNENNEKNTKWLKGYDAALYFIKNAGQAVIELAQLVIPPLKSFNKKMEDIANNANEKKQEFESQK